MSTSTPDSRYLEFDNVWEAGQYIFYRKALFELFKEGNFHPSTEDIETKMEERIDKGLKDFFLIFGLHAHCDGLKVKYIGQRYNRFDNHRIFFGGDILYKRLMDF